MKRAAALSLAVLGAAACSGADRPPPPRPGELVLSEIASSNPGGGPAAARDEHGDYDDWIELYNTTDHTLDLAGVAISDTRDNPRRYRLPDLAPIPIDGKSYLLLFADGEVFQGPHHLPFGLGKDGESLVVTLASGEEVASTEFPEMSTGRSWARGADGTFSVCVSPTPGAANVCDDGTPPPKHSYEPYEFPRPFPARIDAPVVISELDPHGATRTSSVPWIELHNASSAAIDLATLALHHTRITPADALPGAPAGERIALAGTLAPGERAVVDVPAMLPDSAVLLLFGAGGTLWDRVFVESVAPGTILAQPADGRGLRITCDATSATPGAENGDCLEPGARISPPPMVRVLGSLADFDAMAGATDEATSDAASVKFVVDRANGNAVYFVDSGRWLLHFDWVWEEVEQRPPFDLCITSSKAAHLQEWGAFSQANYFVIEGRRFYLGTLIHFRDSDLWTIEFTPGDRIAPHQVEETYFHVANALWNGTEVAFRPTTARLEQVALQLEGGLSIIGADRPFDGQTLQTLNPGVGYGVLEVVNADEIETAPISYESIVILDRIPSELPPVNGSITGEFQTPLSHVNVLAQNRGTPNMALKDPAEDPRVAPFIGQLVRFEVTPSSFSFRVATATEAEAFWEERIGSRPEVTPERDLSVREVLSLDGLGFADSVRIGAKAAQYAELVNLDFIRSAGIGNAACSLSLVTARLPVPRPAFAIPFARYVEHLQRNGIDAEIDAFLEDEEVQRDPLARRAALRRIRDRIEDAPLDPDLLLELTELIRANYGNGRVRFRSSTNVEDLAGFNGAGLYESHSAQLDSEVRPIEGTLKEVWSSIWTARGYDERKLFGVDQRAIAMAVLIHRGFPDEEANGVAISRNVVAPRSHGHYVNAQIGEISVVQPEGGYLPEQLLYKFYTPPEIVVLARSSVNEGEPVLTSGESHQLACVVSAIHNRFLQHYASRIPTDDFAVDVEWKLAGPERAVTVKQARPWIPGAKIEPAGCFP